MQKVPMHGKVLPMPAGSILAFGTDYQVEPSKSNGRTLCSCYPVKKGWEKKVKDGIPEQKDQYGRMQSGIIHSDRLMHSLWKGPKRDD